MAVDTPAKIAILGAGPIGLEAALYARFLGYEVEVFDVLDDVGGEVIQWGDQPMFAPFGENCSPLGMSALSAQDPNWSPPQADEFLTHGEWLERYIRPLSKIDLLAESLAFDTGVLRIGRVELSKDDCPTGEFDRGAWDFRLLLNRVSERQQRIVMADVVFDCEDLEAGPVGHGGIHAVDEDYLTFGLVDRYGFSAGRYTNRCVLLVGEDLRAAWVIDALMKLRADYPATKITWITRHSSELRPAGPFVLQGDVLPQRETVMRTANQIALSGEIEWWAGTWVESVRLEGQLDGEDAQGIVRVAGEHEGEFRFDRIVSKTAHRPDWSSSSELQLDICPITDAPRPFSEYLLKRPSPYSVEYPAPNPQALITSEPNYYVLGSKSFGRMPGFLYQHGLRQIRDVFTIIGDRADLDLYAQMR